MNSRFSERPSQKPNKKQTDKQFGEAIDEDDEISTPGLPTCGREPARMNSVDCVAERKDVLASACVCEAGLFLILMAPEDIFVTS